MFVLSVGVPGFASLLNGGSYLKKRLPRVGSLLTCLVGVPRLELGTS